MRPSLKRGRDDPRSLVWPDIDRSLSRIDHHRHRHLSERRFLTIYAAIDCPISPIC
ncbi:MAG: hypothetical protein ACJA0M_002580 [Chitinophagales bacterium]|jgi:hypothetical protein